LRFASPDGVAGRIRVHCARNFLARLRGLVGRSTPAPGAGFWIEPCAAVHTFGVCDALDVVFVSSCMVVQRIDAAVPPHSVRIGPGSRSVLELRAGEAARIGIRVGARLAWRGRTQAVALRTCRASNLPGQRRTNMPLAVGLRLARALLTRGAIVTATVTAVAATVGACAAQAGSPTSMPVAEPADAPLEAVDPPDAQAVPGVGAGAVAGLSQLLDEGEAAYRARRGDEALAAFQRVVTLDPGQAQAWLRLGNLHQQRQDWYKALAAYRRVAARSSGDGVDPSLRAKALYNLAIINLELAQQSLRTLERIGPAATVAGPREPLSSAVTAAQRRLTVFASPAESPVRAAPAPAPAPPAPSRASKARDRADSDAPRIDYIRGAPRP
jgi:uncharacterized membrane protein (UPF0127 family)